MDNKVLHEMCRDIVKWQEELKGGDDLDRDILSHYLGLAASRAGTILEEAPEEVYARRLAANRDDIGIVAWREDDLAILDVYHAKYPIYRTEVLHSIISTFWHKELCSIEFLPNDKLMRVTLWV